MTTKVLLIDHAPFFGGSESFLLDLLTTLDRQTYTPIIVTDPCSPILDRLRASGDPVLTTPFPQINRSPFFAWRLLRSGWQLAQLAQNARADLMHTFTARTHLIGAVASRLSGIPLLWRIGDDTLPTWVMSLFGRVPQCIVAVSHWITTCYPDLAFDGLVADGARPPSPISRAEARAEFGFAPDELVVVHIGRLVRWKGQAVFIRALAQAAQTVPSVRGLIVGTWHDANERPGLLSGGQSYYNELCTLATELGLNSEGFSRIVFAGFVADPGLAYAAADIVVHTSILPEPFGRTVIEAMISGRPVVAARSGALPEIVVEGETGLLTPPGDSMALANALIELLTSDERRLGMGLAARQRAEAEYTLAIMTHRMEEAYQHALARRPSVR